MSRSFTATLDGPVAPYLGDPRFNRVSVRSIDERTIEKSNLDGDTVVQTERWHVDPDGTTMHVRLDDTRGDSHASRVAVVVGDRAMAA